MKHSRIFSSSKKYFTSPASGPGSGRVGPHIVLTTGAGPEGGEGRGWLDPGVGEDGKKGEPSVVPGIPSLVTDRLAHTDSQYNYS